MVLDEGTVGGADVGREVGLVTGSAIAGPEVIGEVVG